MDKRTHGKPEILNRDQGSQRTSSAFTGTLKRQGFAISMDGRGRVFDNIFVERLGRNVKYEDVYPKVYATVEELTLGLAQYFALYNGARSHQALGRRTPALVYRSCVGGGALIVEKYPRAVEEPPVPLRSTDASSTAEATSTATSKATSTATPGQRRLAASEVTMAA